MTAALFDAIVIGSGFGGAVAACRLAQAGLRVCILERGQRYPMGSFPRDLAERERWLCSEHTSGLIDAKPLRTEMIALQASGYGGGSLLYNNVQMRAPHSAFASGWPAGWDRDALDPYYDLVGYMLDVRPISAVHPQGLPPRTAAMAKAAAALGRHDQYFLPNLAVDFSAPGVTHKNKFGVDQQGCTHCGECFVGCNVHAKNTLDLNYLALAERAGAVVKVGAQVTHIDPMGQKRDPGYWVTYLAQGSTDGPQRLGARYVFLCAGSINSTELLLRCRDVYGSLRPQSPRLGHGYSANGDFLSLVFRTQEPLHPSQGPCITSAVVFDQSHAARPTWFLLEDGGASAEISRRGQILDPKQARIGSGSGFALWLDVLRDLGIQLAASPPSAHTEHSAVLLLMGQDSSDGQLSIEDGTGLLKLSWHSDRNLALYNMQTRLAQDFAQALGGELVLNPLWQTLHQPITIHNLGGCNMADSPERGVTDSVGEIFGHPGLFVLDGARLPRAVGANPSHTIAATAERSIEALIRRFTGNSTWQAPERAAATRIVEPLDRVQIPVGGCADPRHNLIGAQFRETMRGHLSRNFANETDYVGSALRGKPAGMTCEFTLEIVAPDLDSFLIERDHTALASGSVTIPGITPPDGATVTAGVFNLFVQSDAENARKMLYALPFYGADGSPYLLDGWKDIRDHGRLDVWESTTTLYTTLRRGHSRSGEALALGTLHIDLAGVLHLLSTLQISGTQSTIDKNLAITRIGSAFFGTLWNVYIRPRLSPSLALGSHTQKAQDEERGQTESTKR